MTLTGTDNAGGAGIDKTEYRIDGGAFTTYTAPIAVATDGNHTIEYRSVDKNEQRRGDEVGRAQARPGRADQHRDAQPGHPGSGRHV